MLREEILNSSRELVNRIYEKMSIIETCDSVAKKVMNLDVCFNDIDNKQIVALEGILRPEQLAVVRESIIKRIYDNAAEAQFFLERLNKKPATINPEFEAAVQGMVESAKPKDDAEASIIVDKHEPDPVVEKLTEILQEEAKKIEEAPAKKLVLNVDDVRRMYHDENKSMKEIAEHFGVTKSVVNNFIYNNNLGKKHIKDDIFLDSKVEAKTKKERP